MLAAYATSQYREMQVQTTPGKLVIMLYDGAIRFLHLGVKAMERGDVEARCVNLQKAQNILLELRNTLDMSAGPISYELAAIYHYCIERLLRANVEDRADYIREVIGHLSPLRDAWEQADRAVSAGLGGAPERQLAGAGR